MQPDEGTLIQQAIFGVIALAGAGFIGYKIIRALAAFVEALEGDPETPIEHRNKE